MDVQPWLPRSVSESNYGYYEDPKELDIYRENAPRDGSCKTARSNVPVQQARAGRGSALYPLVLVEPASAAALLRPWLEDRAEPLLQPGFGDGLA